LLKMIYKLASSGPFAKDFGLRDQIQREAISYTLSAVEVQSLLYTAFDVEYY